MTCEPISLVGFRRIGFISTDGSTPAASACTTCARPISSPSRVMNELSAMFCALNGATRSPSCRNTRHSPAAIRLLPALDIVPWIMIGFAIQSSFAQRRRNRSTGFGFDSKKRCGKPASRFPCACMQVQPRPFGFTAANAAPGSPLSK